MLKRVSALVCAIAAVLSAEDSGIKTKYSSDAARLIDAALKDNDGLARLEYLCDRIGHRLSGSAALSRAVEWSAAEMKRAGLANVRVLPVKVPHWVRGRESLVLHGPVERSLSMLGLGGSVGTPADGITAEVVVVSSFEELNALGANGVRGKVVVYNQEYRGYGATVAYRTSGASRAARLGAVAALVRSITGTSLRTPHTGMLRYDTDSPRIPAAGIAPEDAQMMGRLFKAGVRLQVTLKMEAHTEPDAESANVIGEIPGREKPEEVVVLGGHLDSWDVGQGAQDDGAGVTAALAAVGIIKQLGLQPRRTIRVAFWTNEENGLSGGRAYRDWLGDTLRDHVAAIEMDGGAEKPVGFSTSVEGAALARVADIGELLSSLAAGRISKGGGGADIAPIMARGVPGLGLLTTGERYMDWHHTEADTFDKVNPEHFRQNVAALAVMAWVLADMPERLTDLK